MSGKELAKKIGGRSPPNIHAQNESKLTRHSTAHDLDDVMRIFRDLNDESLGEDFLIWVFG